MKHSHTTGGGNGEVLPDDDAEKQVERIVADGLADVRAKNMEDHNEANERTQE